MPRKGGSSLPQIEKSPHHQIFLHVGGRDPVVFFNRSHLFATFLMGLALQQLNHVYSRSMHFLLCFCRQEWSYNFLSKRYQTKWCLGRQRIFMQQGSRRTWHTVAMAQNCLSILSWQSNLQTAVVHPSPLLLSSVAGSEYSKVLSRCAAINWTNGVESCYRSGGE